MCQTPSTGYDILPLEEGAGSDARSLEEGAGKRCSECERVYVSVAHDLELLRYVLRCAIERQL